MKSQSEQQADDILREWAASEHISLRRAGIIDERRGRTIHERETPFSVFFGRKRRAA